MPTIRPHKKSRNGCQGCRRRKIKCDEVHPSCTFCSSRGVQCIYPVRPTKAAKPPTEDFSTSSSPTSTSITTSNASNAQLWTPSPVATQFTLNIGLRMGELKLLHNYSVVLSPSLALTFLDVTATAKVWQGEIPRLAFEHDFLMHTMLSISSHHIQCITADADGDTIALSRQTDFYLDTALQGYRNAVANLNLKNIEAVLAASVIMVVMATSGYIMHVEGELWIVSWLGLHAGTRSIEEVFGEENRLRSPLYPLLCLADEVADGPSCIPPILEELLSPPNSTNLTPTQIRILYETLRCLGEIYALLDLEPSRSGQGKIFLKIITAGRAFPVLFVNMVKQQVPQALVLVAHYLSFLKSAAIQALMAVNISDDLSTIISTLDPYWMPYLQTPLKILRTEDLKEVVLQLMLQLPEGTYPVRGTPIEQSPTSSASSVMGEIIEEDTDEDTTLPKHSRGAITMKTHYMTHPPRSIPIRSSHHSPEFH